MSLSKRDHGRRWSQARRQGLEMDERRGQVERSRAVERVVAAARAMARELRRRELAGDTVAGELCETFEKALRGLGARDAGDAGPRPVGEGLSRLGLKQPVQGIEGLLARMRTRMGGASRGRTTWG